jgi:hypothetical protein
MTTIFAGAHARLQITSDDGTMFFDEERAVDDVDATAAWSFDSCALVRIQPTTYRAAIRYVAADGAELAETSGHFVVSCASDACHQLCGSLANPM